MTPPSPFCFTYDVFSPIELRIVVANHHTLEAFESRGTRALSSQMRVHVGR